MIARYGWQQVPVLKFLQWDGWAWNGLMRHDPTVGTVTADQLVVGRISWFGCEANEPPKCQSYTAADELDFSRSGLRMNLVHNDTRVSTWSGISSKLHCSAVSLVPMPLVSLIPSLLYPRIGVPLTPLYYLPPPTTAILLFLTSSTSLTDLCYLPPPPPQLLLSILPLTRYTLLS